LSSKRAGKEEREVAETSEKRVKRRLNGKDKEAAEEDQEEQEATTKQQDQSRLVQESGEENSSTLLCHSSQEVLREPSAHLY